MDKTDDGRQRIEEVSLVMKSSVLFVLAASMLLLAAAVAGGADDAVSPAARKAGEIIAKHVAAVGGVEKIRAIRTLRAEGKLSQSGVELPFTLWMKRPNLCRLDVDLQGASMVQAHDGEKTWWVNPLLGIAEPREMPEDLAKAVLRWADFEGPLVEYEKKGYKAEYAGEEETEKGKLHKIKLTLSGGEVWHVYLDAKTFLEAKRTFPLSIGGEPMETTTRFGGYAAVNGVQIYRVIEGEGFDGSPFMMRFESVVANPEIDDARFKKP
jgi:outer membrane lipoprotein-sorting protein